MAKGPVITPNVRKEIAKVYMANPDWRAKEVQNELRGRLKDKAPGLSSIQKELGRIRAREGERWSEEEKLNRPWTIGTLTEYELAPEAVRILLLIQAGRKKEQRTPLKVREALWVARLHAIRGNGTGKKPESLDILATWGQAYALREKVCAMSNTACDTADLDEGLLGNFGQVLGKRVENMAREIITKVLKSKRIEDIRKEDIRKEDAQEFLSDETAMNDIMAMESQYFGYALGDPNMDTVSLALYRLIVNDLTVIDKEILMGLETKGRKVFFMSLRKWIKNNIDYLHKLDGEAPIGDPKRVKLFESIDFAKIGIIGAIQSNAPESEIPAKAQASFLYYMDGNHKYITVKFEEIEPEEKDEG